jgi:hypothetical protein
VGGLPLLGRRYGVPDGNQYHVSTLTFCYINFTRLSPFIEQWNNIAGSPPFYVCRMAVPAYVCTKTRHSMNIEWRSDVVNKWILCHWSCWNVDVHVKTHRRSMSVNRRIIFFACCINYSLHFPVSQGEGHTFKVEKVVGFGSNDHQ